MDQTAKDLGFHHIKQIGIVVSDMDKTIENFSRIFHTSPRAQSTIPPGGKQYKGKEAEFNARLVFFDFDNIEVEFIQPLDGESVWKDFLEKHGPGIHHILFYIKDAAKVDRYMQEEGVCLEQSGPSSLYPGARWGYYDTTDLIGFVVEINNPEELGYLPDGSGKKQK